MKPGSHKSGFTLIEMLAVVAIIAILVSMVISVTRHVDDQRKERLCRSTIAIIGNALEQFRDFGYEYKDNYYAGLTFPIDCNGFNDLTIFQNSIHNALYSTTPPTVIIDNIGWAQHDPSFSGSEALYFVLSQVPDCRTTLDKIDKSLLTNKGIDKVTDITITIQSSPTITMTYPFIRIIDPWGKTLRYNYYDKTLVGMWPVIGTQKTFPVVTSAGPDRQFDTADDISNVK
jgi:prepilin-type N-terminal cleavage/methylation domain-containing protein